jgi:acyl-CoA oxidase
MTVSAGITITDNGPKKGLNGVDNGMIKFSSVYLERTALLANFGYVNEVGMYVCPFKKESTRFSELLSTLSGGRGVLASGANVVSLKSLFIALNYSNVRRQFSGGGPERPLISYISHRRKLGCLLAKTVVLTGGFNEFQRIGTKEFLATKKVSKNLHALTSAFKVACSEHAELCCQESRVLLGGHGYAMENEVAKMHNDIDIYRTFEGDNTLLRQEVCKYKLGDLGVYVGTGNFYRALYAVRMKISNGMRRTTVKYDDPNSMLSDMKFLERFKMLQLVERMAYEIRGTEVNYFDVWNKSLDKVLEIADLFINRKVYELAITAGVATEFYRNCLRLHGMLVLGNFENELVNQYCNYICNNYQDVSQIIPNCSVDIPITKLLAKL